MTVLYRTPELEIGMTGIMPDGEVYTLHATHCALHTTHYTLHTTHYTLHTTHYTLHTHPTPYTLTKLSTPQQAAPVQSPYVPQQTPADAIAYPNQTCLPTFLKSSPLARPWPLDLQPFTLLHTTHYTLLHTTTHYTLLTTPYTLHTTHYTLHPN